MGFLGLEFVHKNLVLIVPINGFAHPLQTMKYQ